MGYMPKTNEKTWKFWLAEIVICLNYMDDKNVCIYTYIYRETERESMSISWLKESLFHIWHKLANTELLLKYEQLLREKSKQ